MAEKKMEQEFKDVNEALLENIKQVRILAQEAEDLRRVVADLKSKDGFDGAVKVLEKSVDLIEESIEMLVENMEKLFTGYKNLVGHFLDKK